MKVKVTGSVLCYNFENDKYSKLSAICKKYGIKIRMVEKEEFNLTVGQMMGFSNSEPMNPDFDIEFDDEMMILYNIVGSNLDKFLKAVKEQGISVPYKAVLTAANQRWFPAELVKELAKEHEKLKK